MPHLKFHHFYGTLIRLEINKILFLYDKQMGSNFHGLNQAAVKEGNQA